MPRLRTVFFAVIVGASAWAQPSDNTSPAVLTSVAAVRELSRDDASRAHPVRVRATVTSNARPAGYHVQDHTGPIFVFSRRWGGLDLEVGQVVEIEGVADPGRHAPQIRETTRKVVGTAPLPVPREMTYDRLISGNADGYYAEISGVIRRVTVDGGDPRFQELVLAMGEGRVTVSLYTAAPADLRGLVDARVRLRGVVSGALNDKRQWVQAYFNVCRLSDIVVEDAAPEDPFSMEGQAIDALLQWRFQARSGHRVKVRGVVAHHRPDGPLFIADRGHGLEVRLHEPGAAQPGDIVEVLGFPAPGTYSAVLEDAVFRRVGRTVAPEPVPTTAEGLLRGNADASLISVEGTLLESVWRQSERTLVVQAGDVVFNARIDQASDDAMLERLPPGAALELTGICVVGEAVRDGRALRPKAFSLVLRGPEDVVVLKQPPWWTAERLVRALALAAIVTLGVLGWVWLLRRQVRAQAAILAEKSQREAVLSERARIAREFHDTLEADLTGVSLQLDAAAVAANGSEVGRQLQLAHRLLQRSQKEVRQSVWDLRRAAFGTKRLADAIRDNLQELAKGAPAEIRFESSGEARQLPALAEHHLQRIAREAVTNALKHARAREIVVRLGYAPDEVRLTVQDDGCGFVCDEAPGSESGHFGLLGMQERASKIDGQLSVRSRPGAGTCVEVSVPIPSSPCPLP